LIDRSRALRYAKNSVVINASRDIPLLRQVRNSRFISYQQLFVLLHHAGYEQARNSFNWRIHRLLDSGHIHACENVCHRGHRVYRITQKGLLQLESYGDFMAFVHSQSARPPQISQVFHALDLNEVRVALAQKNLLANWQSEVEIASANLMAQGGYQKDYDAIVDVWVSGALRRFALEYERVLKSADRYQFVCDSLASERQIGCVLYLTAGQSSAFHLAHLLQPVADRVVFATLPLFCRELLETPVFAGPDQPMVPFEQILTDRGLPFPGAA
jgi:hypothetical protein